MISKPKRMTVWPMDNSIMIENKDKEARAYNHITSSSWDRIEKLTWYTHHNNLEVRINCGSEGLLFVSIDRR